MSATDGTERDFVRVAWSPSNSPAVTGYRILRRLPGGQLTQLDAVPASSSTINDKMIAPGVVGTYEVRCITALGDSAEGASDTGFRPADGGTSSDDSGSDGGADGGVASGDGERGGTADRRDTTSGRRSGAGTQRVGGAGSQDQSSGTLEVDKPRWDVPGGASPQRPTCDELVRRILETPDRKAHAPECDALLAGDIPAACRMAGGDINLDGRADDRDIADFLIAWASHDLVRGDLNRDGGIDQADFGLLLSGCRPASK